MFNIDFFTSSWFFARDNARKVKFLIFFFRNCVCCVFIKAAEMRLVKLGSIVAARVARSMVDSELVCWSQCRQHRCFHPPRGSEKLGKRLTPLLAINTRQHNFYSFIYSFFFYVTRNCVRVTSKRSRRDRHFLCRIRDFSLFFFSRFFFPLGTTIQTPRYSRSKLVIAVIAVFRHDRRDWLIKYRMRCIWVFKLFLITL